MRQKVALAGALVHDPKLIILDEPLTGLDAGTARQVKNVLRDRVRAGGTVIMTTHILEVAERMADRIGVIAGGRLIAEGTLDDLRDRLARPPPVLRTHSSCWWPNRSWPRESTGFPDLVGQSRTAARLARLDLADDRGRTPRARNAIIALIVFAAFMHVFAYWTVASYADANLASDTAALVGITGTLVLSWSLLLSQAMESVDTRVLFAL